MGMSSQLSVAQVLANLEEQMRFHREREEQHAAQEAFHRDQRAVHAAEYETVARHYEAFKASAAGAAEIAARSGVPAPAPAEPLPPLRPVLPSRLVARAVAEMPAGETFVPSRIASEVNRRYSRELRRPIDSRLASTALRRLMSQGRVRLVTKGTAHREAVYARG
jgi:ribosomal protein S25